MKTKETLPPSETSPSGKEIFVLWTQLLISAKLYILCCGIYGRDFSMGLRYNKILENSLKIQQYMAAICLSNVGTIQMIQKEIDYGTVRGIGHSVQRWRQGGVS